MRLGIKKNLELIQLGEVDNNYLTSETLDSELYDDITSIENWSLLGLNVCTDHLQKRSRIIDELNSLGGWSYCSATEKLILIENYARGSGISISTDSSNKVGFLMSQGYTLPNAINKFQESYANFHVKEIEACESRARSPKVYKVVAKYLNISGAADFIRTTESLFNLYVTQGIRGVNDGEAGEGLFDFIESTSGTSFEFLGLNEQGYTLLTGTIEGLIEELMDILRNGNY